MPATRSGRYSCFRPHEQLCRVPAEDPQTVPVTRVLLMGAAVPVGDCKAPGSWREKVSSLFRAAPGRSAVENSDVVLYSQNDEILGSIFQAGERWARQRGLASCAPHDAVGLAGGPLDRWTGEHSCGLKHDQYPRHPVALRYVAALFGPLVDRQDAERKPGERRPNEQHPDERMLESVPSSG